MDAAEVVEHLLKRAQWSAGRSSGPGGQHRDKASTRADLVLTEDSLEGLEPDVAERVARGLRLAGQPLRISVQEERSLARNQQIAEERLAELVVQALAPPPPPRRPTKPSRSAREARLTSKVRRARTKRLRQPPE